MGVQVNEMQVDDSTALHVAAYYGQRGIVGLLLEYGAHPAMINRWGSEPTNEASSEQIKQVIQWYRNDRISQIVTFLIEKELVRSVRLVKRRGKLIGKEILRHEDTLDVRTRNNLDFITSNWVTLWHGTKSSNIESILRYGLLLSGTKLQNGLTMNDFPVIGYPCFAHRILGSPGGKHCESLQRNVWRGAVSPVKAVSLDRECNILP